MSEHARVLVVAATSHELGPVGAWHAITCGVGPVEAAAATARAIAERRPDAIVHVGIAGARRSAAIAPLSLVVGTASLYCDLDAATTLAPRTIASDATLIAAVQRVFPDVLALPIGTSARVGGTADCAVEAMEGFAVLRAAAMAGVPAIEVRCIANVIEEPDRTQWRFAEAFATIIQVTPSLVHEVAQCVR